MVESALGRGAGLTLVDSTEVELPPEAGLNSDGNWLLLDGFHKGVGVARSDISELGVMVLTGGEFARSISSSVWVLSLRLKTVLQGVIESVIHETTVATLRGESVGLVAAVDEVLLRDLWKRVALKEGGSLKGSGGGERPAGSALSLVLDTSDSTLFSPVDLRGDGLSVRDVLLSGSVVTVLESEKLLELSFGPVHHVVLTEGGGVLWVGVVLLDLLLVLHEDGLSVVVLLHGDVALSVSVQVGEILEVVGGGETDKGGDGEFH